MLENTAVLVDLSIGYWTAQVQDKQAANELDEAKNTKVATSKVVKDLLAGSADLANIRKYASMVHGRAKAYTYPWNDNGTRLLPVARVFAFNAMIDPLHEEFNDMVTAFLNKYPIMIQAASIDMGAFFNPLDYPDVHDVASKFYFRLRTSPVPTSGDFRIDAPNDMVADMKRNFEESTNLQMTAIREDMWDRLYKLTQRFSNQLRDGGRVYDTTFEQLNDLVDLLQGFNPSNDPDLAAKARSLQNVVMTTSSQELRDNKEVRKLVKSDVDAVLSKFSYGA